MLVLGGIGRGAVGFWARAARACSWGGFTALALGCLCASGCGILYPEASTPLRDLPRGAESKPAPPRDLLHIRFKEVVIPERTRDGRLWEEANGSLPDPIGRLILGEKNVVVETPVQRDTLVATWPDQVDANYWIPPNQKIRVEIWDRHAIANEPICVKPIESLQDELEEGEIRLRCDSGTRITLTVEPALPRWGLGMTYEVADKAARIIDVYKYSPVVRAGLAVGDEITAIDGVPVAAMDPLEVTSAINAKSRNGVKLQVRTALGRNLELTVKEGPIYLTSDEIRLNTRRKLAGQD